MENIEGARLGPARARADVPWADVLVGCVAVRAVWGGADLFDKGADADDFCEVVRLGRCRGTHLLEDAPHLRRVLLRARAVLSSSLGILDGQIHVDLHDDLLATDSDRHFHVAHPSEGARREFVCVRQMQQARKSCDGQK